MDNSLLGELSRLNNNLWWEIYEAGFNSNEWPEYLMLGKILEAVDKEKIITSGCGVEKTHLL